MGAVITRKSVLMVVVNIMMKIAILLSLMDVASTVVVVLMENVKIMDTAVLVSIHRKFIPTGQRVGFFFLLMIVCVQVVILMDHVQIKNRVCCSGYSQCNCHWKKGMFSFVFVCLVLPNFNLHTNKHNWTSSKYS